MTRTMRKGAILAALLSSVLGYAQAANASRVYATIEGTIQGTLKGNVNRPSMENKTEVLRFEYSVTAPAAAGTGRVTNKREHGLVRITKVLGPASPQLFQALVRSETLKSVLIDFVSSSPASGQEFLATQIRLSNAKVVSIEQVSEAGDARPALEGGAKHDSAADGRRILEEISFSFATIEITSHEGKTSAADSTGLQ